MKSLLNRTVAFLMVPCFILSSTEGWAADPFTVSGWVNHVPSSNILSSDSLRGHEWFTVEALATAEAFGTRFVLLKKHTASYGYLREAGLMNVSGTPLLPEMKFSKWSHGRYIVWLDRLNKRMLRTRYNLAWIIPAAVLWFSHHYWLFGLTISMYSLWTFILLPLARITARSDLKNLGPQLAAKTIEGRPYSTRYENLTGQELPISSFVDSLSFKNLFGVLRVASEERLHQKEYSENAAKLVAFLVAPIRSIRILMFLRGNLRKGIKKLMESTTRKQISVENIRKSMRNWRWRVPEFIVPGLQALNDERVQIDMANTIAASVTWGSWEKLEQTFRDKGWIISPGSQLTSRKDRVVFARWVIILWFRLLYARAKELPQWNYNTVDGAHMVHDGPEGMRWVLHGLYHGLNRPRGKVEVLRLEQVLVKARHLLLAEGHFDSVFGLSKENTFFMSQAGEQNSIAHVPMKIWALSILQLTGIVLPLMPFLLIREYFLRSDKPEVTLESLRESSPIFDFPPPLWIERESYIQQQPAKITWKDYAIGVVATGRSAIQTQIALAMARLLKDRLTVPNADRALFIQSHLDLFPDHPPAVATRVLGEMLDYIDSKPHDNLSELHLLVGGGHVPQIMFFMNHPELLVPFLRALRHGYLSKEEGPVPTWGVRNISFWLVHGLLIPITVTIRLIPGLNWLFYWRGSKQGDSKEIDARFVPYTGVGLLVSGVLSLLFVHEGWAWLAILSWALTAGFQFGASQSDMTRGQRILLAVIGAACSGIMIMPAVFFHLHRPLYLIGFSHSWKSAIALGFLYSDLLYSAYKFLILLLHWLASLSFMPRRIAAALTWVPLMFLPKEELASSGDAGFASVKAPVPSGNKPTPKHPQDPSGTTELRGIYLRIPPDYVLPVIMGVAIGIGGQFAWSYWVGALLAVLGTFVFHAVQQAWLVPLWQHQIQRSNKYQSVRVVQTAV